MAKIGVWDGPEGKNDDFGRFFHEKSRFLTPPKNQGKMAIFFVIKNDEKSIFPWDLVGNFIVASIPSRRGDQLLHWKVARKGGYFGLFCLFFYKFRWVNKMPSALYFLIIHLSEAYCQHVLC